MEKKKNFTSWGVSFASVALAAGMVSYLGFSNQDTLFKSNQTIVSNQNSNQQTPAQNGTNQDTFGSSTNNNGASSNSGNEQSTNDNGSSFSSGNDSSTDGNNQPSIDNGSSGQDNNQFSGGGFGHHRGFDTTTGGT